MVLSLQHAKKSAVYSKRATESPGGDLARPESGIRWYTATPTDGRVRLSHVQDSLLRTLSMGMKPWGCSILRRTHLLAGPDLGCTPLTGLQEPVSRLTQTRVLLSWLSLAKLELSLCFVLPTLEGNGSRCRFWSPQFLLKFVC